MSTAYNRCLSVAMSYSSYPQNVTVDISDLALTQKEAEEVEELLWGNGELWWVNTFSMKPTPKSLTITFKYDDAAIDSMRAKFESAVALALKRVGPGMTADTKVHMLHDYIIKTIGYQDKCKNAYEALVNKRADCFGFALVTDVLFRRAGFETDLAWTSDNGSDHSWNLVKVGAQWYHVDTTWDRFYTYQFSDYYKGKVCHKWLLQSDEVMGYDEHSGWKAHHRCTSSKYENEVTVYSGFIKHCNDYKSIVRSFNKGGLKYTVTGVGKASVSGVTKKFRSKKALSIPATVTYKKVKYTVNGIKASAFKVAKAKTLYVQSKSLAKARVANCLVGSKVKAVKVLDGKVSAYKKIFAKANSGRKVSVKGMTASTLKLKAASIG